MIAGGRRAALHSIAERYPAYFDPPNPLASRMGGHGAYSGYEGKLDGAKLRAMGCCVNWKAGMDFPYMGQFLPPPVGDEEPWNRFAGGGGGRCGPEDEGRYGQTSLAHMEAYSREMRAAGFHLLNYFNATEFGGNIVYPPPGVNEDSATRESSDLSRRDLWKDPNAFLYGKLAGAILMTPGPIWTWGGTVIMDCGDPAYRAFLLEQARRHIEKLPSSSGICIDRMDWLTRYSPRGDDGVSWIDRPQRSLLRSWIDLLDTLGPMMHQAGKVIFANDMVRRPDLMRHIDGFYDEHGMWGFNLNTSAFLALRKPLICWTPDEETFEPDLDGYLQRHLYLGAFATVPYPGNDHAIQPGERAERLFRDYGPLFDALCGRKWVLVPRVVAVTNAAAKANVFEVKGAYVVPVVLGGYAPAVRVSLRGLPGLTNGAPVEASILHPGRVKPRAAHGEWSDGALILDLPLVRGCALLRLRVTGGR